MIISFRYYTTTQFKGVSSAVTIQQKVPSMFTLHINPFYKSIMKFIMLNLDIWCINIFFSVYCTCISVLLYIRLCIFSSENLYSGMCLLFILYATNTYWRDCVYLPLHLHFISETASWYWIRFSIRRSILKVVKRIWFSFKLAMGWTSEGSEFESW